MTTEILPRWEYSGIMLTCGFVELVNIANESDDVIKFPLIMLNCNNVKLQMIRISHILLPRMLVGENIKKLENNLLSQQQRMNRFQKFC